MDNNQLKCSKWIIYCGFLWGLVESSGGWMMHLLHVQFLTPILITFGIVFMGMSVIKTHDSKAAILVASITALIKLSNLFLLSYQPIYWVLSPALHIMAQGIIMTLICEILFSSVWKNWFGIEVNSQHIKR